MEIRLVKIEFKSMETAATSAELAASMSFPYQLETSINSSMSWFPLARV